MYIDSYVYKVQFGSDFIAFVIFLIVFVRSSHMRKKTLVPINKSLSGIVADNKILKKYCT